MKRARRVLGAAQKMEKRAHNVMGSARSVAKKRWRQQSRPVYAMDRSFDWQDKASLAARVHRRATFSCM